MADTKISGLAAVTTVSDTDEYVLARSGASKKITGANLKAGVAVDALLNGDAAGGVLSGTYPDPSFAADMATQAELNAHTGDTSDAHDASAISFSPTGTVAATDVQAAIAEVASEASAGGIPGTILDAKGDLIVASAADTAARLAVGTKPCADGRLLAVDRDQVGRCARWGHGRRHALEREGRPGGRHCCRHRGTARRWNERPGTDRR